MSKSPFETMLNCFEMNDKDEILPNKKWNKLSPEERDHIRLLFGSNNYETKKTFKASNGITYTYKTLEDLCYLMCCIQCPNEKQCHDNCENCEEYEEQLAELEKENK